MCGSTLTLHFWSPEATLSICSSLWEFSMKVWLQEKPIQYFFCKTKKRQFKGTHKEEIRKSTMVLFLQSVQLKIFKYSGHCEVTEDRKWWDSDGVWEFVSKRKGVDEVKSLKLNSGQRTPYTAVKNYEFPLAAIFSHVVVTNILFSLLILLFCFFLLFWWPCCRISWSYPNGV